MKSHSAPLIPLQLLLVPPLITSPSLRLLGNLIKLFSVKLRKLFFRIFKTFFYFFCTDKKYSLVIKRHLERKRVLLDALRVARVSRSLAKHVTKLQVVDLVLFCEL